MQSVLWAVIACGVIAVLYGVVTASRVMAADAGTPRMQEIAQATPRGRYLRLQGPQAVDILYREGLAPLPKSESGEKSFP